MKKFALILVVVLTTAPLYADLQMPHRENFYDRLGHGLANIFLAPANLLDSPYELLMSEGPTVASTKGMVQGVSRTFMDVFVGVAEVITSPFPVESLKSDAYDSHSVEKYPPSDLLDNWY